MKFVTVYRILFYSFCISFFYASTGCNQEDDKDITLQDFGTGIKVQLPENKNFPVLSKDLDLNLDGHPDYLIYLTRFEKDDIYYNEDVFYITLKGITTYLQIPNPFQPIVLIDDTKAVQNVGSTLALNMVRYYQASEEINDTDNWYFEAFISKADEYEIIQPLGLHYIPVLIKKGNTNYYGWIEINLDLDSITIKRMAFCKTAEKKIKIGQVN